MIMLLSEQLPTVFVQSDTLLQIPILLSTVKMPTRASIQKLLETRLLLDFLNCDVVDRKRIRRVVSMRGT